VLLAVLGITIIRIVLGGGLAVGLIIAVALIPDFAAWTAHTAALHGHH
jgi:hypothetical protein